jgi:TPR repeat protein
MNFVIYCRKVFLSFYTVRANIEINQQKTLEGPSLKIVESELNRELGVPNFSKSAENLYNEYKKLHKEERFAQALDKLFQSANDGLAKAEFELGKLYYFGNKQFQIYKNYSKAFEHYSSAAEQGHALAEYYLGFMYFKGQGADFDVKQAVHWLSQSANQGVNEALDLLGRVYHLGYDVITPDYDKAEKFFQYAVNQLYAPSMFHYGLLLEEMQRFEEACELINKAAELGNPEAVINYMSRFN